MHHLQGSCARRIAPYSLCCLLFSACSSTSSYPLPAPTEDQLLRALQRMDPYVQSIALKQCTKDPVYHTDMGGTIADLWTCRLTAKIKDQQGQPIDVQLHLGDYNEDGWYIDSITPARH